MTNARDSLPRSYTLTRFLTVGSSHPSLDVDTPPRASDRATDRVSEQARPREIVPIPQDAILILGEIARLTADRTFFRDGE